MSTEPKIDPTDGGGAGSIGSLRGDAALVLGDFCRGLCCSTAGGVRPAPIHNLQRGSTARHGIAARLRLDILSSFQLDGSTIHLADAGFKTRDANVPNVPVHCWAGRCGVSVAPVGSSDLITSSSARRRDEFSGQPRVATLAHNDKRHGIPRLSPVFLFRDLYVDAAAKRLHPKYLICKDNVLSTRICHILGVFPSAPKVQIGSCLRRRGC